MRILQTVVAATFESEPATFESEPGQVRTRPPGRGTWQRQVQVRTDRRQAGGGLGLGIRTRPAGSGPTRTPRAPSGFDLAEYTTRARAEAGSTLRVCCAQGAKPRGGRDPAVGTGSRGLNAKQQRDHVFRGLSDGWDSTVTMAGAPAAQEQSGSIRPACRIPLEANEVQAPRPAESESARSRSIRAQKV